MQKDLFNLHKRTGQIYLSKYENKIIKISQEIYALVNLTPAI